MRIAPSRGTKAQYPATDYDPFRNTSVALRREPAAAYLCYGLAEARKSHIASISRR
jgi:hypothetical protein